MAWSPGFFADAAAKTCEPKLLALRGFEVVPELERFGPRELGGLEDALDFAASAPCCLEGVGLEGDLLSPPPRRPPPWWVFLPTALFLPLLFLL